jgi:predicted phage terminase large subunit-like protein
MYHLGVKENHVFLLNVYRKRLGYPELKRAVREQAGFFGPQTILIEDKASGTQLIQELVSESMYQIKQYEPTMEKIMRMNTVTSMIENGFVHLPEAAPWLAEYLHELTVFPNGTNDDQVDSTSQGLHWIKSSSTKLVYSYLDHVKNQKEKASSGAEFRKIPDSVPCTGCGGTMAQRVSGGLRCQQCGAQWNPPAPPRVQLSRANILARRDRFRLR